MGILGCLWMEQLGIKGVIEGLSGGSGLKSDLVYIIWLQS